MSKLEELKQQALETLENDDTIFVGCVNALDDYKGFADGYRCYPMYELDEFYGSLSLHDFLNRLTDGFKASDNYFYETIWGLDSCDFPCELYRDNTTEEEVLTAVLDYYPHLFLQNVDSTFADLIEEIDNCTEEE